MPAAPGQETPARAGTWVEAETGAEDSGAPQTVPCAQADHMERPSDQGTS